MPKAPVPLVGLAGSPSASPSGVAKPLVGQRPLRRSAPSDGTIMLVLDLHRFSALDN